MDRPITGLVRLAAVVGTLALSLLGPCAMLAADPSTRLRLEVRASDTTARVVALLPWGARVPLQRTADRRRFLALAPLPSAWRRARSAVTYILTDRAHNRTSITVDMRK